MTTRLADYNKTLARYPRTFLWTRYRYYWPVTLFWATAVRVILQLAYGRLTRVAPAAKRVLDVVDDVGANGAAKMANGKAAGAVGGVGGETASKAVADGDYTNGSASNGAAVRSQ